MARRRARNKRAVRHTTFQLASFSLHSEAMGVGCCSINKSRETEVYRLCCCSRALRIILYLWDGHWHYPTADGLFDAVWFSQAVYSFVLLRIITSTVLPLD